MKQENQAMEIEGRKHEETIKNEKLTVATLTNEKFKLEAQLRSIAEEHEEELKKIYAQHEAIHN